MDCDEEAAHLEWWADQSTCLARVPVRVIATPSTGEWRAVVLPPFDDVARQNLEGLLDVDACFTLRFGASAIEVQVEHYDRGDRLRLAAIPGSVITEHPDNQRGWSG
ncbi:hypothetical protein ACF053_26075 [Streptomyces kanasensis]|uniref:hypothetical protein n=1 Tax=Streptomyces kanasensis TaxID=936756 RepID=UPI003700EA06